MNSLGNAVVYTNKEESPIKSGLSGIEEALSVNRDLSNELNSVIMFLKNKLKPVLIDEVRPVESSDSVKVGYPKSAITSYILETNDDMRITISAIQDLIKDVDL